MNALAGAAKSLETEIAQTKMRLHQLESTLGAINTLMSGKSTVAPSLPAEIMATVQAAAPKRRGPKPGTPRAKSGLPPTGSEFWFNCLGTGKKTMGELVDAALKKLELTDAARPVMAARATSWLYPAIKAETVKAAGKKGDLKAYQKAG